MVSGLLKVNSEVYQWYLDDYSVKSKVYQWYLVDYRDNLRSTSGIMMTIGKVGGLPVVPG